MENTPACKITAVCRNNLSGEYHSNSVIMSAKTICNRRSEASDIIYPDPIKYFYSSIEGYIITVGYAFDLKGYVVLWVLTYKDNLLDHANRFDHFHIDDFFKYMRETGAEEVTVKSYFDSLNKAVCSGKSPMSQKHMYHETFHEGRYMLSFHDKIAAILDSSEY